MPSWCFLIWTTYSEKWVCFFNFIPNRTLNSMQVLMEGMWWRLTTATDEGRRMGDE